MNRSVCRINSVDLFNCIVDCNTKPGFHLGDAFYLGGRDLVVNHGQWPRSQAASSRLVVSTSDI